MLPKPLVAGRGTDTGTARCPRAAAQPRRQQGRRLDFQANDRECDAEDGDGEPDPEGAVPQHWPGQRDEPRVLVGHGPVPGHQAGRGQRERIHDRAKQALVEVAQDVLRNRPDGEERDALHVDRQQIARDRANGEEQGAHEQDVGNDDDEEGPQIAHQPELLQPVVIDPRHPRPDEGTQWQGEIDQQHDHTRTGKAARQVAVSGDTGGKEELV